MKIFGTTVWNVSGSTFTSRQRLTRNSGKSARNVASGADDAVLADLDRTAAVRALEENDAGHDAARVLAGDAGIVRVETARRDDHRIVLVVQLAQRNVAPDVRRQAQVDVLIHDAAQ